MTKLEKTRDVALIAASLCVVLMTVLTLWTAFTIGRGIAENFPGVTPTATWEPGGEPLPDPTVIDPTDATTTPADDAPAN